MTDFIITEQELDELMERIDALNQIEREEIFDETEELALTV